ncbi:MAG: DUF6665 family protein [Xanthobacteraceae bacterium]
MTLPTRFSRSRKPGEGALDYEIVQEQAAALGRLGRTLEAALAALANHDRAEAERGDDAARARSDVSARARLVQDASDALWCFIIQREACGLRDWRLIVREYGVPAEVQNRMGVFDGGRPRNSLSK